VVAGLEAQLAARHEELALAEDGRKDGGRGQREFGEPAAGGGVIRPVVSPLVGLLLLDFGSTSCQRPSNRLSRTGCRHCDQSITRGKRNVAPRDDRCAIADD